LETISLTGVDRLSRCRRAFLALALVTLATAAPCAATPAWSEPEAISRSGSGFVPRVAMDAVGNTLVAWVERTPDGRIVSAYRWWRPDSGWGPVREVPRARGTIEGLEITPHGQASVLLLDPPDNGGPVVIAIGTARPGEAIEDFETVTENAGSGFSARFGLDDAGDAIVAWNTWADPYKQDEPDPGFVAIRRPGGKFGSPQHVGDFRHGPHAAVINAAGAAAVAWGGTEGVSVTYRPPGGSFGPAEPSGLYGPAVDLALDVGGRLAITSATPYLNAGPESRARYSIRSPLGQWSEARVLDADGIVTDLFFDPRGALTFFTNRPPSSGNQNARVITLQPDGSIDDAPLASGTTRGSPAAAMDLRGDILAAWVRPQGEGPGTEVVARERGFPGGAFGPEVVLAHKYGDFPVGTALNDLGQGVVAWSEDDGGGPGELRAAVRDDPALHEVPLPPDVDIYKDPLASLDGDGDLLAPVRCIPSCKVKATGIVFPGGQAEPVAGGGKSKRLAARKRTRVKLDFGTKGAKAVRDALAAGRRPWVSVSVSARGKSPRPFVVSRRFKIRR
jgi:hypothetical protein